MRATQLEPCSQTLHRDLRRPNAPRRPAIEMMFEGGTCSPLAILIDVNQCDRQIDANSAPSVPIQRSTTRKRSVFARRCAGSMRSVSTLSTFGSALIQSRMRERK